MGLLERFRKRPQRPDPKWVSYRCDLENGPGRISMDAGWMQHLGFDGAHWQIAFTAAYRALQPEGRLYDPDELPLLQDLVAAVEGVTDHDLPAGTAFLIANTFERDRMVIYIYTKEAEATRSACRAALDRIGTHAITDAVQSDSAWKTYSDYLYPHPADWQQIANQSVIANLARHGDDGSLPRKVDHAICFSTLAKAEALAPVLEAQGYRVTRIVPLENPPPGQDFRLECEHDHIPLDLDPVTVSLFHLAKEHGGTYDGWGCMVLRPGA